MLNRYTLRNLLIWNLLCVITIGGILSSCTSFQQETFQQTPTLVATQTITHGPTHTLRHPIAAHNISYTSAAYYAQLSAETQKVSNASSDPIAHFTVTIPIPNATQVDATKGVQVKVCASSDDDGAAVGEDVFLTADSNASFLTNVVTLDDTGCANSTLFAPNTSNVTIYAAINYITPAFNRGGDEVGTYALPAIAKQVVNITKASKPILPSVAFGLGRGSSPFAGESVNLALGNYIYQHTDISLPVHGGTIALTRTYNSLDTSDGPFGVGWSFSYNQYLTIYADRSVSVTYSDGHHEVYVFNNGKYTPVAGTGVLSRLVEYNGVYTVLHKDQSRDTYDTSGKLISIFNSKGDAIALRYNNANQLIEVYDGFSGRGLSFVYDSNSHINSVIDTLNIDQSSGQPKTYTYTYNSNNQLAIVTEPLPLGYATTYGYSNSHNGTLLTTITDRTDTLVLTNSYDSSGRVISQKNALGGITTFTYNTGSTVVTNPDKNSSIYAYDFFYREISFTDPLGNVTDYTYDNNGELRTVTDGNGNTVEYTYDANGNLNSIIDAIGVYDANTKGHTTTYAYDKQNHLLEMVDADEHKTIYRYDSGGNVISIVDALGDVTQFDYQIHAGLTKSISPDGGQHIIMYGYDNYGDQTTVTDGYGRTQTTYYDADGLPVKITDAVGHSISTVYDVEGHIEFVTNDLNDKVSYLYDQNGNRVSVVNANQEPTNYVYDALNRLIAINNPDNTSIQYSYDADGNLLRQLDQSGHRTTYTYDKDNRVLSVTDALGNTTRYTYDHVGNVISRTDGNNQTTSYIYDEKNELIEVDYADGTFTQFTYDGVGNRLTMTDTTGTSRYVFDNLNRLVTTTDSMGHKLSMSYDPAGNMTSMTYPDGRIVNYTYDNNNRLLSVTDWAKSVTGYSYDAAGNLIKMSLPNHVVTTYTYDAGNRLTGISNVGPGGTISAFTYKLDAMGQHMMVSASGSAVEVGNTSYFYDTMGRLTMVNYPDGSRVMYSYDQNGNRSTMVTVAGKPISATTPTPSIVTPATSVSTTIAYGYNATDELTQVASGATKTTMSYDNDGNLTTSKTGSSTTSYRYNVQDELASVSNGTITVSNTYNGDGFRVSKSVTDGSSTNFIQYVLSPTQTPQVLEEVTGKGETTDELYGSSLLASDPMNIISTPSYYSYDGSGSVRNVTDSTGKASGSYSYDAFGALRSSTGKQTEFQLNGQQVDTEDGLTYLRSRYYDPTLGRFISRDTDPGSPDVASSLNHYVYANSNPINFSDPTGKFGWDTVFAFIIGAIFGAVTSIVAQAISGKGINWAAVAYDAVIGGVTGVLIDALSPEAVGVGIIVAKALIGGVGGGVGGAGDYCIENCGTSHFNLSGLEASTLVGTLTGAAFGALDLGSSIGECACEMLREYSTPGDIEIVAESNMIFDSQVHLDNSGVNTGTNTGWPESVGGFVGKSSESIAQGVASGFEERLNLNDTLAERLKQFNVDGGSD